MPAPLLPPFDKQSATAKVRLAENAWNSRDPERIALAYTPDSQWRNREQIFSGRPAIIAFLKRKWQAEDGYRLIKQLWAFDDARIAVRFQYEWHDPEGQWFRAYGNELWRFDSEGLMAERHASINDIAIEGSERRFHWNAPGPRPGDHSGLESD